MDIITTPFGGIFNAIFALAVVIVGIVLVLWLLKLLQGATGRATGGRNRRLAVVESLALDPKRQLLIIRRDNVDHLILTGGAQDLVIETGIAVDPKTTTPTTRRPVPMVPPRKPAPAAPAPAAATPAPTPAPVVPAPAPIAFEPPGAPGTVLAELQKQGRPIGQRAHLSLRHTGLLRPVNDTDLPVSPEFAAPTAQPGFDSAKEDAGQAEIEGTDLGDGSSETKRN
jgi:hypothetical protein